MSNYTLRSADCVPLKMIDRTAACAAHPTLGPFSAMIHNAVLPSHIYLTYFGKFSTCTGWRGAPTRIIAVQGLPDYGIINRAVAYRLTVR